MNWKRFGQEIAEAIATDLASPYDEELAARLMGKREVKPRKVTGVLTFLHGEKVTVRAACDFENQEVPFRYDGDTTLFRPFAPSGTLGFFKWYLESLAANLGAEVEFFEEG